MRRHSFDYEALAGEEYQVLKPDLVKVQESVGNSAFANEIKQATSRDAFFKVPLIYNRKFSTRKAYTFRLTCGSRHILEVLTQSCVVKGGEMPGCRSIREPQWPICPG